MARTPASNDAFFREVDDEVRRDRMERAARRYGVLAVVVVVVALLALGGFLWWQHHRDAVAGERGERMVAAMAALSAGDRADAGKALSGLAAEKAPGYSPLAQVLRAEVAIQAGKPADAAATFMTVAGDASAPQPVRDLALVRATAAAFDTLAPAEVVRRMKPLAVPGNAWFGSAAEMTALAEIRQGQRGAAGTLLARVAQDRTVPQSLRDRAGQLAGDLGVAVVQPGDSNRS